MVASGRSGSPVTLTDRSARGCSARRLLDVERAGAASRRVGARVGRSSKRGLAARREPCDRRTARRSPARRSAATPQHLGKRAAEPEMRQQRRDTQPRGQPSNWTQPAIALGLRRGPGLWLRRVRIRLLRCRRILLRRRFALGVVAGLSSRNCARHRDGAHPASGIANTRPRTLNNAIAKRLVIDAFMACSPPGRVEDAV